MDLSIIILNYKCKDLVKVCLNNLKASDLSLDYEIIVVDNGSNDGISEMLNNFFPKARLVKLKKNKGYSAGNNAGIKEARGKYILILNPDVTVGKMAIKKMHDFMEMHPDTGITAPQLLNPDRSIQRSCMRFHSFLIPVYRRLSFLQKLSFVNNELDRFQICDWDHNSTREVDWMLGACLTIRKKTFDEVGLFDERYFLFFEDTDICRSFKMAGWKRYYLADARVIHLDERLSNKATGLLALKNKTTWIHINSWLKYFWKWRGKEE
ncbi:glycosyltransferase family 2 protein [Patescibacteria group bacterium]